MFHLIKMTHEKVDKNKNLLMYGSIFAGVIIFLIIIFILAGGSGSRDRKRTSTTYYPIIYDNNYSLKEKMDFLENQINQLDDNYNVLYAGYSDLDGRVSKTITNDYFEKRLKPIEDKVFPKA